MLPFSYALRNLSRDPARLAQTVGGAFLVVFLLLAAIMFNGGMDSILSSSGSPQNVLLVGKGSEESIERSEIPLATEPAAATSIRGLAQALGLPAVSGEITYQAPVTTTGGAEQPALLRGVLEEALLVYPQVRLLEGQFPAPGQVLVGQLAHRRLKVPAAQLAPGQRIRFSGSEFAVAGIFAAPGTVLESEIWFDRNDLASLTQRDSLSTVVLRLDSAGFDDVQVFALQRNDLELAAIREDAYFAKLASFYSPIKTMAWLTVCLIAAGALFGGLNTLYAAFASRTRELATLQAIGYTRLALVLSLIQESLLATLVGTLLATLAAMLLLDGRSVPFSLGTFTLALSPAALLAAVLAGVLLGTLGALPPAIHTLSPPLPKALRSS